MRSSFTKKVQPVLVLMIGCYIGPLRHLHATQGPICGTTLQPSHLGHARSASSLAWAWAVHGAFYFFMCLKAPTPPGTDQGLDKNVEVLTFKKYTLVIGNVLTLCSSKRAR